MVFGYEVRTATQIDIVITATARSLRRWIGEELQVQLVQVLVVRIGQFECVVVAVSGGTTSSYVPLRTRH